MGKTFRRGGNERGYYSPGKSLRDKRQRGGFSRNNYDSYDESYQSKNDNRKSKYKESFDNFDGEWA